MPWVAKAFPWLLIFDAVMVLSALTAAIFLVRRGSRMTAEETRGLIAGNQYRAYRDSSRHFRLARRAVVIGAGLDVIAVAILLIIDRLSPELADIFFLVIGIGFFAPLYISLSVLEKSFTMFAERCERLLDKSAHA
jgi:hypothetical protein